MDILFAHSDDLVVSFLTKWLFWGDIARLDTACASSNSSKENLRRLLASKEAVFPTLKLLGKMSMFIIFSKNMYCKLFQWFLLRNIKVADLVLMSELIANAMMEQYFLLCGSGLQSLNVIDHDHKLVSIVLKHCPLKTLQMQNWEQGVQTCSFFSESIETFDMSTCSTQYRSMPDDVVINFPKLKNLAVSGSDLPESVLVTIIKNSIRLQRIKLRYFTSLNAIKPTCQTLQHLTLERASFSCSELGVVLQRMPQLTELILVNMFDTDKQKALRATEAFNAVAGNCPALTVFHLVCKGEQDKNLTAFIFVLDTCPQLREISVCGEFVSDAFLHTLATHSIAPRITHLSLTECDVSEVGLTQVAQKCSALQFIGYSIGIVYRTTEKCKGLFRQGVKVVVTLEEFDDL